MWEYVLDHEDLITSEQGYKWLFIGLMMGVQQWGAIVAVSELMDQLLTFLDNYNTKNWYDKNSDLRNDDFFIDLAFHLIEFYATFLVASVITSGS